MKRRFSPSEAALEGFQIIGRSPGAILVWALMTLAIWLLSLALLVTLAGDDVSRMARSVLSGHRPALDASAVARFQLAQLAFVPLALLAQVLVWTAVLRAVRKPQQKGFGYLRLGLDEFLQLVVRMAVGLVIFAVIIAFSIATVILTGIAIAASGVSGGQMEGMVGGSIALVALIAAVVATCMAVRLSLSPAITFAYGRLSLFESWNMTRGQFWPIVGAYILAAIFTSVVSSGLMLASVVLGFVMFFVTGVQAAYAADGLTPAFYLALSPTVAAALLPMALAQVVNQAIICAAPAHILRALESDR
jgi:hypothetical protein